MTWSWISRIGLPFCLLKIAIVKPHQLFQTNFIVFASPGMLSILGTTTDTYLFAPVASYAGAITEITKLEAFIRDKINVLQAICNTKTAGKNSNKSAVFTVCAILRTFV